MGGVGGLRRAAVSGRAVVRLGRRGRLGVDTLTNPTGRNLRDGGRARLAFGDTQDVVLLDGDVRTFEGRDVPGSAADAFAAKTGWDPRADSASYAFFRILPYAVQAWHGEHELRGRHLMRDGVWVA